MVPTTTLCPANRQYSADGVGSINLSYSPSVYQLWPAKRNSLGIKRWNASHSRLQTRSGTKINKKNAVYECVSIASWTAGSFTPGVVHVCFTRVSAIHSNYKRFRAHDLPAKPITFRLSHKLTTAHSNGKKSLMEFIFCSREAEVLLGLCWNQGVTYVFVMLCYEYANVALVNEETKTTVMGNGSQENATWSYSGTETTYSQWAQYLSYVQLPYHTAKHYDWVPANSSENYVCPSLNTRRIIV